jgi:uncharacterized repeat protein (TIGR01451 family)
VIGARVYRWEAGITATLVFGSLGLLTGNGLALIAGVVPLGFVLVAAVSSQPADPGALSITRDVSPATLYPGDEATVEVTVHNTGDTPFPSVHVEDAVPEDVTVVDGPAKIGTALRAGERTAFEYTVTARRGTHVFAPPTVRLRSLTGAVRVTDAIPAAGTEEVTVTVTMDELLLPKQLTKYAGPDATSTSGAGIEFHSLREYRHGDPVTRIDWRSYAKTDDLATINYRERRARRVAIVVDGRPEARLAQSPARPDGASLSAYAGLLAAKALRANGHDVAFAGLGVDGFGPTGSAPAWIPADASNLVPRMQSVCDAITDPTERRDASPDAGRTPGGSGVAVDSGPTTERDDLLARLPPDAQVLLLSPLTDDVPVELATQFETHGHPVTTISPDVVAPTTPPDSPASSLTERVRAFVRLTTAGAPGSTTGETASAAGDTAQSHRAYAQELAAMDRAQRFAALRSQGIPVVDWPQSRPLPLAMTAALLPVIGNG